MTAEFNFEKIVSIITKAVSDPNFYLQSLLISGCFIAAYVFAAVTKRFFLAKKIVETRQRNIALYRLINRYLLPIFYPASAFIFLLLSDLIYLQFSKENLLFNLTASLIGLFIFLRFIRISADNKIFANSAGFVLVPAVILNVFGLLESAIFYLDQYDFEIGSFRLSIYLVLKGFVVILLMLWLSNLISRKTKALIENSKEIKSSTKNIISKIIDIVSYCVVGVVLLKTFGVDMTTLAVLGGAIGVGIGFGLQKIASNFISGIILLIEKSIEIGDWVEIDNGNIFGVVKKFSGRYTLIECFDGKEIMVPNEEFIINKVSNWTYSNNRARIEITIGVAQNSDLVKTRDVMLACAIENARCISYPEPECYITDFGEYDVKFVLYFWINDIIEGRMKPKSEVMLNIWQKLKENKITISVPQREVLAISKKKKKKVVIDGNYVV